MRAALARHDEILREAVEKRDGRWSRPPATVSTRRSPSPLTPSQLPSTRSASCSTEAWPLPEPLRVRMGLHTGVAEVRDGDYYGTSVNRAARVAAAAHGGQVVASAASADLVRDDVGAEITLSDLGEHRLRDLGDPSASCRSRTPICRPTSPAALARCLPGKPARATHRVRRPRRRTRRGPRRTSTPRRWSPSRVLAASARRVSRFRSLPTRSAGSPTARGSWISVRWRTTTSSPRRSALPSRSRSGDKGRWRTRSSRRCETSTCSWWSTTASTSSRRSPSSSTRSSVPAPACASSRRAARRWTSTARTPTRSAH